MCSYHTKTNGTIYVNQVGMRRLNHIFIAICVLCLMTLATAYLLGSKQPTTHTDETLWHKNIEQLKTICNHKYRQSLHYTAYAHHAERDSLHNIAALFHAIAYADAVQCDNCRKAIESLGGTFSSPIIRPTTFSKVETHLAYALRDKQHIHQDLIPRSVEQALNDNNRYIARMLTWCDASDIKQIFLLQSVSNLYHARYRICPICSDISWEVAIPRHCPHCMTDSTKFVIFSAQNDKISE